MNVWEIIEAIDDPSGLIHPEKRQAFATGQHPLGKHPAYPEHRPEPGQRESNYEEILASRQWKKILEKAQKYLGVPLTKQALPTIQQKLLRAMGLIDEAESNSKEQLQALAIKTIFSLSEFKTARRAYETNRIGIDARLVDEIDTSGMATSDEPEAQEWLDEPKNAEDPRAQRTPADKAWMDKMVQRRHFTNALIQGSAVSNDYLFELAGPELDRIHPGLRQAYGILMVSTELGYWMFPQSAVIQGAKAQTHVGAVQITTQPAEEMEPEALPHPDDDQEQGPAPQKPVVVAQGACFPVLMQEIIKGLTELASLPSLPRDPSERKEVISKADLTDLESWSMILGPKLWDSFIDAVDANNERELAMHLYSHIQRMDVDKFNSFMKEVLAKSPSGMQMLKDLAAKIRAEIGPEEFENFEESMDAEDLIEKLIENEEDDVDWKEISNEPRPVSRQDGRYSQPFPGTEAFQIENAVRRLGIGGTEKSIGQFTQGIYPYVTIEFPEGSGQAPMTARFITEQDADEFLARCWAIVERERPGL